MDKIITFIMNHPDVTVEIKKDANVYQSISIKMWKNNAVYKEIIGENRLTGLGSILVYMYSMLCNYEEQERIYNELADMRWRCNYEEQERIYNELEDMRGKGEQK